MKGRSLKFIVENDYESMSRSAADIFAECIENDPSCTLGLATGSTPEGLYSCLAEDNANGRISFKDVTTFNLDEYCDLPADNEQSYRYFMNKNLFDRVDIDPEQTHLPSGVDANTRTCILYEADIADKGIDIQLLGIGHNGHIGFNEPCDEFPVVTHLVDLKESTIEANSRFFNSIDDVPKRAITMGIGTIMKAKKIVVVANGEGKAEIVKEAFFGPVIPQVPASVLQLHPDVTVVLDQAAAKLIPF